MDPAIPCNFSSWKPLIDQLHKLKEFRIHTGNINNYVELKLKRFTNSAEELVESLKLMMSNLPSDTEIGDDGMLLLADKKHCDIAYERDDLKITLKLFIEKFEFQFIKNAVEAVLKQLQTDSIEQLILSFPEQPVEENDSNEEWFTEVLKIWKESETTLVSKGKVLNMGVADFQLPELKRLFEAVTVKPRVVHVFIEGCCMVPPELQSFAQENSIQLLTHNDPKPFPLAEVFHSFCGASREQAATCKKFFTPVWAARYTVWVRRRSLMAAKGFIVQFMNAEANFR